MKIFTKRKLSLSNQIYIASQLSVLIGSGLTLHESLSTLGDEAHSKKMTTFFNVTAEKINRGEVLSECMVESYNWKPVAIALVRVGEVSGSLGESFSNIANELSRSEEIKKKIIGALIYPACVAVFALILIVGIVSFIFPKIIPVLQSLKGDLPFSTRVVIFLADFLKHNGIWVLCAAVLFIVALSVLIKKSSLVRIFSEKCIMHLPLFGGLYRAYAIAHICKSIGTLTSAEINLVEAIEISSSSVPSVLYRELLVKAKEKIVHGERLSDALAKGAKEQKNSKLFPNISINLLAMGERGGSLPSVCKKIAEIYEKQFEADIETFSKMIEPALMIVLGITVGFIAISIITPIYEITSNVRK